MLSRRVRAPRLRRSNVPDLHDDIGLESQQFRIVRHIFISFEKRGRNSEQDQGERLGYRRSLVPLILTHIASDSATIPLA
jgi:hypothetical protein